jgi:uncharacterized coiled-coil protein SlyX
MRDKYVTPEDHDLARTDELPVLAEDAIVAPPDAGFENDALDERADTARRRTVRMPMDPIQAAARRPELSGVQSLEETVKAVLQEFDEGRATRARLESAVAERDVELKALRADVTRQREELDALRARAGAPARAASPDDIESLTTYIAGSRERWEEMERLLGVQTERIGEMERELEQRVAREQALEKSVHDARAQVEDLRARVADTHAARQRADAEIGRLEKLLTDKERSIERQNERLTALQHELGDRVAALAKAQVANGAELRPVESETVDGTPPLPVLICLTSTKPERHVIDAPETLIGRGPDCAIRIVTHFVSREHAKLKHENGKVTIQDCGSKNGVFVNSIRVDRQELEHGDWITIGETQFRFLLEGAQA